MSAEATKQWTTCEEQIEYLLEDEALYESRVGQVVIKSQWGSRNIADGSRVQLAVSQKSAQADEGIKEYKLLRTYPAEPGYEIDEQYNLSSELYLFVKRSVTSNGITNNGENSHRLERPFTPDDHEVAQYLTQEYARSRA